MSQLIDGSFPATSVGADVDYKLLLPPDHDGEPLPLILHLHGAMSSAASLAAAQSAYDEAWASGDLPPALVACPSTPTRGGFYMDRWETLAGTEFPAHLATRYRLTSRALIGFSMGGYGALKLAFRHPETWSTAAVLCPVIFPAETAEAVPERNRPSILAELNAAMGDPAAYRRNCVHTLASDNIAAIRAATPALLLECGERDEFNLHDGATYLHRLLDDLAVPHTWRSTPDAGHADAHAPARQAAALRFIGDGLKR
jgi:S-formylglutathione hydrolase